MIALRSTALLLCAAVLCACTEEAPPRSVTEFMDDQLLLEAALLRCTQNRLESRYDAECINAREAVKLLEAKEAQARQAELEALSERKRESLRRTQQAAAEARRRAAEMERQREELEYQAQFGLPPPDAVTNPQAMQGNVPGAVIPAVPSTGTQQSPDATAAAPLPAAGSNVPLAVVPPPAPAGGADLNAIREELKRRNETSEAAPVHAGSETTETTAEASE